MGRHGEQQVGKMGEVLTNGRGDGRAWIGERQGRKGSGMGGSHERSETATMEGGTGRRERTRWNGRGVGSWRRSVGVDVGGREGVLEVSPTATQGRVPECPNIAARNEESGVTRKVRAMDDTEVGKSGGHHGSENVPGAGAERSAGGEREGHAPTVV